MPSCVNFPSHAGKAEAEKASAFWGRLGRFSDALEPLADMARSVGRTLEDAMRADVIAVNLLGDESIFLEIVALPIYIAMKWIL